MYLRRDPVLVITATLTLAAAIGANTTVFSLLDSILLRPLPFPDASRLYWISERSARFPAGGLGPDYYSLREKKHVFSEVGAFQTLTVNWAGVDRPEQLDAAIVSPSFFTTLGTKPRVGRTFAEQEQGSKAPSIAVLSYPFWRSRFHSDPNILSHTIALDGSLYQVAGVMPRGFDYPKGTQVWTPLKLDESSQRPRNPMRPFFLVSIVARSRAGISDSQVQSAMPEITRSIRAEYPREFGGLGFLESLTILAEPLQRHITGDFRPALFALTGAVLLVLLIACANLANLLLARAASRRRELAVRMALGAGKSAVLRQLLGESCLLALPGGAAGVLLALGTVRLLNATKPLVLVNYPEIVLDWRTLLFTALLTLLTGMLFGLAPAIGATGIDLLEALKAGGHGQTAGRRARGLRHVLIVAELAVSLVLLIGAGLLARSFLNLARVNVGFPSQNLLTLRVNLTGEEYATGPAQQKYHRAALERIAQLPGVSAAAFTTGLPLSDDHPFQGMAFQIAERPPLPPAERPQTDVAIVSTDYFRTLGVPLRAGRFFDTSDREGSPDAVIVNEAFVRAVFPGENPLGRHMLQGRRDGSPGWVITGVVGDVRSGNLGADAAPLAYRCTCQQEKNKFLSLMRLIVRTTSNPWAIAHAVEEQMYAVDRTQPVTDIKTMEQRLSSALAPEKFQLLLIGTFACIAIVLAGIGVYGVMAYLVTRRTREIGIRIAVGAQAGQVQRLVLAETASLAIIAAVLGLGGAWGLTRYLRTMLYGVTALDAPTFGIAAFLLVGLAIGASMIPARRAAAIDPVRALREE